MFALPRTGPLGVNVQWTRAAQQLLLRRGFGGCPSFYPTSNVRLPTAAERGTESIRGFTLPKQRERASAFTLIELLIVVGIIALLLVLIAPAFTYMKSASDFTSAVYGIQGALDSARTYAKANHTYVFVGFAEVDASVDPSVNPQVTTGTTPYGRVAVAVVASKDGTLNSNTANLVAIGKLQRYENLHFLVSFPQWIPLNHPLPISKMARNYPASVPPYLLGGDWSGVTLATPFSWPLSSSLGNGQYNFTNLSANNGRVIYFDPRGIARIALSNNADEITQVIELDLQPTHGTLVPAIPTNQDVGNQAVIQIVPMSGEIHVFRP